MVYVLGIDGGNSKTLAVLANETGTILGIGRAGCGSHQVLGRDGALEEIRSAAETALEMAGCRAPEVAAVYYCLAGADLPQDFALLRPALKELALAQTMGLNNDSMASLRAGTDNPNAVCVAVGAGTVAVGRRADGREIRLPSLGWISGDWGGGGDLARDAIWYTVRMHDGRGEQTMLHDMVLRALDVPNVDVLIERLYFKQINHRHLLQLAPLVFEAANMGDGVARALLERQGIEVAVSATALLRRLDLLTVDADLVLGGSIFWGQGSLLLDTVHTELSEMAPRARIVVLDVHPVLGAMLCALDLIGLPVDEHVRGTAKATYQELTRQTGQKVALQ